MQRINNFKIMLHIKFIHDVTKSASCLVRFFSIISIDLIFFSVLLNFIKIDGVQIWIACAILINRARLAKYTETRPRAKVGVSSRRVAAQNA